jgi:CRP-like cAMP-binding protein
MDAARLKHIPLFSDLSRRERKQLARWTDEVDVPAGSTLAAEGDFAHEFFVIEEGTAEVTQGGEHLRDLGPGDFFGEIGLLEEHRRTATVRATSPMKLVVMFQREFRSMSAQVPEVAEKLEQAITERWEKSQ